ncbi:Protein CBG27441 [Caenorhabditis briggsae]|uniref:Protein CBG27441 n=1 Tax=Caenorhabditis briggsae TaxID=6238 RepID=B6IK18_CAEBR|nr:Protein CBG27441 [Caenorhabditis briggsae]CAS00248.1 Protein CBG27441 [Caenorhabditis briggsae]
MFTDRKKNEKKPNSGMHTALILVLERKRV